MRVLINSTFQLCGLVALASLYSPSAIAAGLPQLDFATFPPQLILLIPSHAHLTIRQSNVQELQVICW